MCKSYPITGRGPWLLRLRDDVQVACWEHIAQSKAEIEEAQCACLLPSMV